MSASDTETASAFHLMNQPSNASSENSSYSTISEERTFSLFHKLPIELRLKIWKDVLPSPRLIHFNSRECIRDHQIGKALSNAINEQLKFTVASEEVYGVFRSSYEKLILPHEAVPDGNDLFLVVDYRIETLVISQFLEADIQPSLKKVRKLAMIVTDYPEEVREKFWDACPNLFHNLTTLDFLRTVNGIGTYRTEREYEWKLLRMLLEYGDPIELPTSLGDWDVRRNIVIEFGNLRFMCPEAQQRKTKFS